MKKKFLELAEAVKRTGVVEEFYKNLNAKGIKTAFNKFESENKELIEEIEKWKNEYKNGEPHYLFSDAESVEYPMEIAVIIYLMADLYVTEEDLFENTGDLEIGILSIPNNFATAIYCLNAYEACPINEITLEDICRYLKPEEETNGCSDYRELPGEEYGEDEHQTINTINLAEAEDH